MLQSNFELYLTYGFVYLLQIALTNILWIGLAWYGWRVWRGAQRQLADMPADQRIAQRDILVKRAAMRWSRLFVLCVMLYVIHDYWREVEMRRSAHDCIRRVANKDGKGGEPGRLARIEPGYKAPVKATGGGLYIGEECQIIDRPNPNIFGSSIKYMGLMRVYDAKTGELLAREFVPMPDRDIEFEPDEISQRGADEDGVTSVSIQLPPAAWDRFKARMP